MKKQSNLFILPQRVFFFMLFCLMLSYPSASLQAQKVSLSAKSQSIGSVMDEIEKQTGYKFFYNNSQVDLKQDVTLRAKNGKLSDVLSKLFAGTGISYEIVDKTIVLKAVEATGQSSRTSVQKKRVSGKVVDGLGEPLMGATVRERGTGNGTVTGMDGSFEMEAPEGCYIEVSSIGFLTQTVKASGQPLLLKLQEDNKSLDEVVVVGYGVQKKVNLTGSVGSVKGDEMVKRPVVNPASMLQGQIPGLRVTQSSGQPGAEGTSFRIRGQGTYSSAGSDPLVLINGVPGSIVNLDPAVIESVSVLKDAASAAIYGSRAANGVVLVTTKKGSLSSWGKKFSAIYSGGFSFYSPTKMIKPITNSADYMIYYNQARKNSQLAGLYEADEIEKYRQGGVGYPSFDWIDHTFRTAFVQNHNISLSGNAEKTTYNVALNIVDEPGSMRGFDFKKYNFSVDLNSQLTQWLKIGTYVSANYGIRQSPRNGASDAFLCTLSQSPTFEPWVIGGQDGSPKYTFAAYPNVEQSNKNMFAMNAYDITARYDTYDLNGQLYFEIAPMKGLIWHTKFAGRLQDSKLKDWSGTKVPLYNYRSGEFVRYMDLGGGFIPGFQQNDDQTIYTNLYTYLTYQVPFVNTNHNLSVMGGYSQEQNTRNYLWAKRRDYQFDLHELDAGSQEKMENSGMKEQWAIMSQFFRLNYDYKGIYLFEANARHDGTSRIASENRWGWFPSFSVGYRISEEPYMKKQGLHWLSNLKLRASWGQLGNQNIGLYPYQAVVDLVDNYSFDNSTLTQGVAQTAYVNRNLKWETTTVADVGMDVTLWDRLHLVFDWYSKKTTDILRDAQVSSFIGLSPPTVNSGEMVNSGVELSLTWNDRVRTGTFAGLQYQASFYLDRSRNKLSKFGAEELYHHSILREGIPYNSFYMLDCIGVFASQDEIDKSPKQFNDKTRPGDLKFRDANGDNVINSEDRVVLDGRFPNFEYSFSCGASWKGFDAYMMFQGVAGRKIYVGANAGVVPFAQGSMITEDYVKDMWTEENPHASNPRLYYADMGGTRNTRANSYFLRNASYLRLKSLSVGYTFPRKWTQKLAIEKLRVYCSGDNLLTFTPYGGLDPENTLDGSFLTYPQNKIFSFGIHVEF